MTNVQITKLAMFPRFGWSHKTQDRRAQMKELIEKSITTDKTQQGRWAIKRPGAPADLLQKRKLKNSILHFIFPN